MGATDVDRWLYRGGRPNRLARLLNGGWAWLAARGLGPGRVVTLQVPGRRTGRVISFPLVVADYQDERYLVAMLGEATNWVANVRANGGRAVLCRRRREAIRLLEIEPAARASILRAYLAHAPGARAHIRIDQHAPLAEFAAIAEKIPVFRIVPDPRPPVRPG